MMIELTRAEAENVVEFIKMNLLQTIREDEFLDNYAWLETMVTGCGKLTEALEKDAEV